MYIAGPDCGGSKECVRECRDFPADACGRLPVRSQSGIATDRDEVSYCVPLLSPRFVFRLRDSRSELTLRSISQCSCYEMVHDRQENVLRPASCRVA